jgi:hypothetical protein
MRFGLLTYKAHPEYNVGDYIQSLAAAQYLPQVDEYINREKLSFYDGDPIKLIMNGWFMHNPANWPPSEKILPLLISFHLNSQVKNQLLTKQGAAWFKKNEPVGCRDQYTLDCLRKAGINAYLSGCLTSTLVNRWNYRTDDIYFTDVLFRVPDWKVIGSSVRQFLKSFLTGDILKGSARGVLMEQIFSSELLENATQLTHYHTARHSETERFQMAESFLEKYATARLVVTSRLHCALPCLAFGTPVIFVEAGFDKQQEWCRLNGITRFFNTITVASDGKIHYNFTPGNLKISMHEEFINPTAYQDFVPGLIKSCSSFTGERVNT